MTNPVLLERRDEVAVVTLNRPERRNGVTGAMCAELLRVLTAVAATDARVVVLRGAGADFSVGADLGASQDGDGPRTFDSLGPVFHSATLLHSMPQVTIAAIDGGCAGAALGWACACDLRLASDRARFNTAFLSAGVSGDMGLAWSLPRIVGAGRARELLFLPEKFTAADAERIGLVSAVHPAATLHDAAMAIADRLTGHRALALRTLKANLVSAETAELSEYVELETARHLHVSATGIVRSRP